MIASLKKHIDGAGGIGELTIVSVPIILSQASVSLMMLTDRLLLTSLGLIYPAAAMSGNLISHLFCMFFIGLISYITALSGQYLGAGQKWRSAVCCVQGLFLSAAIYPFMLSGGETLSLVYAKWAGLYPQEQLLSFAYFRVINLGSFFLLANCALSSFFSGIGQTKVVMQTNILGVLVNIPLSYYLIFYGPNPGIAGAAWGTLGATLIMFCAFIGRFFSKPFRDEYHTHRAFFFDREVIAKLLRFGGPTGVEYFLIFFSFSTFVQLFHSYGPVQAMAITIAFNWDVIVFLFLWGLNIGIMAMVGKYQGEGRSELSVRTTYSGLKIALGVVSVFSLVIFLGAFFLAKIFVPLEFGADGDEVMRIAPSMLRTVAVYCFATAFTLVFSATLRAAGDTTSCMLISLASNGLMFVAAILSIKVLHLDPFTSWLAFVAIVFFEGVIFSYRFYQARWRSIRVVN